MQSSHSQSRKVRSHHSQHNNHCMGSGSSGSCSRHMACSCNHLHHNFSSCRPCHGHYNPWKHCRFHDKNRLATRNIRNIHCSHRPPGWQPVQPMHPQAPQPALQQPTGAVTALAGAKQPPPKQPPSPHRGRAEPLQPAGPGPQEAELELHLLLVCPKSPWLPGSQHSDEDLGPSRRHADKKSC